MPKQRAQTAQPSSPALDAPALTDAQIYGRIIDAMLDQRLAPGTRLREDELGQVFGVSRTRIRQVLIRLAGEQLVTLVPNAGARVADPTAQDAQEVFAVRRLVEPAIVSAFIEGCSARELRALERNIEQEEAARLADQRQAAIRLAGEFHLQIAAAAGNATLERVLRELIVRTSLVLMRFGRADYGEPPRQRGMLRACECRDHRALLRAIARNDKAAAAKLMEEHLRRLQSQLEVADVPVPQPALAQLLNP
ncbi:MAG: hypothetical protein RL341_959 [Pseudomonadota bacterium]|jgi:DNA-binding GntR family transcriptional regulator